MKPRKSSPVRDTTTLSNSSAYRMGPNTIGSGLQENTVTLNNSDPNKPGPSNSKPAAKSQTSTGTNNIGSPNGVYSNSKPHLPAGSPARNEADLKVPISEYERIKKQFAAAREQKEKEEKDRKKTGVPEKSKTDILGKAVHSKVSNKAEETRFKAAHGIVVGFLMWIV
jgi:hypothetical protein